MPEIKPSHVGLLVGLIWAAPAQALDCETSFQVREIEGGDLRADLSMPCEPYAMADVTYGPLSIAEETSLNGTLTLDLPRIAGARTVSVAVENTRLDAAIPPASNPAPPYVSVNWPDGVRWGKLASRSAQSGTEKNTTWQFGFPGRMSPTPLDILALPNATEAVLVVPVDKATCGQRVSGDFTSSDRPLPRTISLTIPGCDHVGEVVTIPLR